MTMLWFEREKERERERERLVSSFHFIILETLQTPIYNPPLRKRQTNKNQPPECLREHRTNGEHRTLRRAGRGQARSRRRPRQRPSPPLPVPTGFAGAPETACPQARIVSVTTSLCFSHGTHGPATSYEQCFCGADDAVKDVLSATESSRRSCSCWCSRYRPRPGWLGRRSGLRGRRCAGTRTRSTAWT